jgi:O-antigen ligase
LRDLLGGFTLERAIQLAIVATVVSAVLAAGSILGWIGAARTARWVALLTLAALALVYAARRPEAARPGAVSLFAVCFLALALASAAWSAHPRLTAVHAAAFAVLLVACGALAIAAAGRPDAVERILAAIAAAAAVVVLGGLLVLAFDYDRAVQPASTVNAARYQGLGGGPNTATMLLAVAVPVAAYALGGPQRVRIGGALLLALLLGSIVASGSRGALLAAFGGLLAFVLLAVRGARTRLLASCAVLACLAVGALVMQIPEPARGAPPVASASQPALTAVPIEPAAGYLDAHQLLRLQDDVGHPPIGVGDTTPRPREVTGSSGRTEAWTGALRQAAERPVAGYGFGLEDRAFVDRYVGFNSNLPENSYVGLLLQLGVLGVVTFALLVAALLGGIVRRRSRLAGRELRLAAACVGALVAGLILGVFQSYVYAPGSNATASVWICAFMLAAIGTARVGPRRL